MSLRPGQIAHLLPHVIAAVIQAAPLTAGRGNGGGLRKREGFTSSQRGKERETEAGSGRLNYSIVPHCSVMH